MGQYPSSTFHVKRRWLLGPCHPLIAGSTKGTVITHTEQVCDMTLLGEHTLLEPLKAAGAVQHQESLHALNFNYRKHKPGARRMAQRGQALHKRARRSEQDSHSCWWKGRTDQIEVFSCVLKRTMAWVLLQPKTLATRTNNNTKPNPYKPRKLPWHEEIAIHSAELKLFTKNLSPHGADGSVGKEHGIQA